MTYIKIATTSFSGASSVNVDNVFSAAYTHYLLTRNIQGTVTDENINMRLRVSGADDSGANYRAQEVFASSTTVTGSRVTGDTFWRYPIGRQSSAQHGFGMMRLSNPFEAVRTTGWGDWGDTVTGNIRLDRHVFAHDLASSYTGFTLIPASGTITGSVTVYGLKES